MFSATPKASATKKAATKKSYALALALASTGLIGGLGAATTPAHALSLGDLFGNNKTAEQPKFLPVDEAFEVTHNTEPVAQGTRLAVNFDITPEHYVYKDQIKLTLPDDISATPFSFNQTPVSIDDPTFGQVLVFDQANLIATTTLSADKGQAVDNAALTIGWQGCAKAGLCYPPEKIKTSISIAPTTEPSTTTASDNLASTSAPAQTVLEDEPLDGDYAENDYVDYDAIDYDELDTSPDATNTISGADTDTINTNTIDTADITNASGLDESDPFGLASHPWLAFILLFIAGLGLALTPCVLPMLPIVANIVARQENPTVKSGVILTTSYAIGVATAYGILGAIIAVFGESLGIIGWLQNPVILISFAIVFVLLALYMLGVFTIRLPYAISSKMQAVSQAGDNKLGSAGGSLVAGFLSALVVSPCVSAPLFGALIAVSTIGSPLLGFVALFMLGFGLSAPLILIGATQGKIMPKAGEWMNWVKQGFALLLLAVALLLVERVFISPVILMVWALWFMVVATWAWSWIGKGRMLTQALALVAGIWATVLIIGAALGNDDSLHPLASLSAPMMQPSASMMGVGGNESSSSAASSNRASDIKITTLAELDAITADHPNVIVDVTADWCVECRIMDKNLFHNPPAQMQNWQLVRLDITDTTEDSKAVLARYQLFGPPTLLYYQDGQLVKKQVGEIGRQEFEQTLNVLNEQFDSLGLET